MPNIWGSFGSFLEVNDAGGYSKGAFILNYLEHQAAQTNTAFHDGDADWESILLFDASRWSPIYKSDCKTVQPKSMTIIYYIKAK